MIFRGKHRLLTYSAPDDEHDPQQAVNRTWAQERRFMVTGRTMRTCHERHTRCAVCDQRVVSLSTEPSSLPTASASDGSHALEARAIRLPVAAVPP